MRRGGPTTLTTLFAGMMLLAAACTEGVEPTGDDGDAERPPPTDAAGGYDYDDADVTGVVTHLDGTPAGAVDVTVVAGATSADHANAFFALLFTGGLACFTGACTPGDEAVANVVTTTEGTYLATLPDAYLAGYESDTDWFVTAALPAGEGQLLGPASSFEFEVNTPVQAAPPLGLWEAAPTIVDGPLLSVDVAEPPSIADASRTTTEVQFVDETGQTVWTMGGATVDARLLEDLPLRLVGLHQADVRVSHDHGRTIYHQRLATAAVPYAGTHVPMSRGASCTTGPDPTVGCPVTDGALAVTASPAVAEATIDLASPREVGLVIVRGGAGCAVDVSSDGQRWAAFPTAPLDGAPGVAAAPGDVSSARFVRVGGPGCGSVAEVSVWPPTEREPGGDEQAGLLRPGDGDGLGIGVLLASLVAALMVGIVATLLVVRLRDRRRSAHAG